MITVILLKLYLSTSGTYYNTEYYEILARNTRGDYIVRLHSQNGWASTYTDVLNHTELESRDLVVAQCNKDVTVCKVK